MDRPGASHRRQIGALIGAASGEVVVADSTSVNLYKVLSAALMLAEADGASLKGRRIVSERTNFPTDLYIAESVARAHGMTLQLIDAGELPAALDAHAALLMLTHVNYRTGRMHDMAAVSQQAHCGGRADGLGSGAFGRRGAGRSERRRSGLRGRLRLQVPERRPRRAGLRLGALTPHRAHGPRAVAASRSQAGSAMPRRSSSRPEYRPGLGINRFICGTPAVLSMAALECGLDVFDAARAHGGMAALRAKSIALTDLFIGLVEASPAGAELALVTPRDAAVRGSQASFAHATAGYAVMQALIARGVIGDFRAPDILRFGFTPLYTRFVDVFDAVEHLVAVMQTGEWREERFHARAAVT